MRQPRPGERRRRRREQDGSGSRTRHSTSQRETTGDAWPLLLLLLLGLVRRLPRRERFDDVVHTFGLEDDLRAVASRLVCELCAELIDVHILYAPDSSVSVSRPHERQR